MGEGKLMADRAKKEERLILAGTLALVGFGLVMLYSASSMLALNKYGDPAYFLKRQAIWVAMGLSAMVFLWKSDYTALRRYSLPILGVSLVLLVAVLVPGVGAEVNGSRRWFRLFGMSFQPSEFLKPALLVFLAGSLAKRAERLPDFAGGLLPYLGFVGAFLILIAMEPDFGTAATLGAVTLCMLYAAGARLRHIMLLGLPVAPLLYYQLFMVHFRRERLQVYLDPWVDPLGTGFQSIQSFIAFGNGGLTGQGLGEGAQKLLFLPEPHSDFIYSVIGEEFGLAGTLAVLFVYLTIFVCGIKVAANCEDVFGRNLAFGITVLIGLQAFINMGVTTGLLPNKGMPLPFVSAGGTAVLVALACVGMLLSVARAGNQSGVRAAGPAVQAVASH